MKAIDITPESLFSEQSEIETIHIQSIDGESGAEIVEVDEGFRAKGWRHASVITRLEIDADAFWCDGHLDSRESLLRCDIHLQIPNNLDGLNISLTEEQMDEICEAWTKAKSESVKKLEAALPFVIAEANSCRP